MRPGSIFPREDFWQPLARFVLYISSGSQVPAIGRRALRQRGKGSIMTVTIKSDRYRLQTDVRGGLERLENDSNAED